MRLLRESAMAVTVATAALLATPATADDRGGAGYYGKAYPSSWQGSYAGVHVGVGEGDLVGGGQIGYNWQSGRVVYGLEGDFTLSGIEDGCCGLSVSVDWLATVRGRAGYLIDPGILVYATAGVGMWSVSGELFGVDLGSETETDIVFGLGVEGRINENMTARLELLSFDDLGVDIVRAGLNFKLGR